jgi:two-component system OmpR family sensor kinase
MYPSAGDELRLKPAGLLVAVVAFVLTRGFLTDGLAAGMDGSSLAVVIPLAVGLGVVVYGVSLSVSTHSRAYARVVARWYLVGTIGVAGLVVAGADGFSMSPSGVVADTAVVSAAVGGGAAGLLLGVRTARNRQQAARLDQQTEQVTLLHRLLRHEVLNGLTAIRGHAGLLADGGGEARSLSAVEENTDRIERTVEDVGFLVRSVDDTVAALGAVDLGGVLRRCRDRLPDAATRVTMEESPSVLVRGDDHLDTVVGELVTMALERTDGDDVAVDVVVEETTAALTVSAPGGWASEPERAALLEGPPEYDRPDVGYGISIVRLLVGRYGGSLRLDETEARTTVTVELLRTTEDPPDGDSPGVGAAGLRYAAVAGIVAGAVMGGLLQLFTGEVAVIGSLYGVRSPVVGWVAHLFHSVLFATLAVAALRRLPLSRYTDGLPGAAALGAGYGVALWFVAAGVVMSLWLNAIGIPSPLPELNPMSLVAHLVWGATLGGLVNRLPIDPS